MLCLLRTTRPLRTTFKTYVVSECPTYELTLQAPAHLLSRFLVCTLLVADYRDIQLQSDGNLKRHWTQMKPRE